MKDKKDGRINASNVPIKEYALLLFVLAAFNGFHMWIYQALERNGILETNKILSVNLLMLFVMFTAALATFIIGVIRNRTLTQPLKKLGDAAREIARGDYSVRITPLRKDGKKDFIEILFDDFNTMTEKLAYINNNLQELVNEKTIKVVKLKEAILKTMSNMVEHRDNSTGGHIARTQFKVRLLLDEIKKHGLFAEIVNDWDTSLILQSAQLHDVGKIIIDDQILKKPGPLTDDEYSEMKKHTHYGLKIIERMEADSGENELLKHAKIFALTHHEKWDGSGYPNGLSGENIPLQGRIMAIADVYDALISERPYKKAFTHEEAIKIIIEGKGTQFDPVLIDLLITIEPIRFFV